MKNGSNGRLTLEHLKQLFPGAVLLPIPLEKKGPMFRGWQKTTYEGTKKADYQKRLKTTISRNGNVGVLLGPPPNGLSTIDADDDELVESFLNRFPWARTTTTTKGAHGCQIWFRIKGPYPAERIILLSKPVVDKNEKAKTKPILEFRGGGGIQSVCFGRHPDGMRYQFLVEVPQVGISNTSTEGPTVQRFNGPRLTALICYEPKSRMPYPCGELHG